MAAAFLAVAAASAQAPAADVGLITQLSGPVTYWNQAEKKEPVPAKAFMKIRQGDNFKLAAAGSLTLLYFTSGRQETWRGPADRRRRRHRESATGDQKSPAPEVKLISTKATKQLAGTPLFLPRSSTGVSGGIQTMTPEGLAPAGTPVILSDRGPTADQGSGGASIRIYRKPRAANDVTPELYLLSVLGKYGQYAEMDKLVDTMLQEKAGRPRT